MNFQELKQRASEEWERFNKLERPRILIGEATCGRAAGALSIWTRFQEELEKNGIEVDIFEVGCLGMCYSEPNVEVAVPDGRRVLYRNISVDMVEEIVRDFIISGDPRTDFALCSFGDVPVEGLAGFTDLPMIRPQIRVVLRNAGIIDPSNVYHFIARGGYSGLYKALSMSPEEVCEAIETSGLRGRGGAGFPTGLKWSFARKSPGDEKYMICNADEGDPGAFMDRAVLESDPHAVLEGLAIGAYAIGASNAIVYVRAEYPLAIERLRKAITQMRELGFLGENIMGSGFNLDIKIKMGAGAFVCGEETALMASIEGKRGMPRPRPPFPAQSGLHEKPTNINNVETLANVSEIMNRGPEWFAKYGTEKSKGTKTFALAGKINRTGLIEVPMGITIKEIIYDIGGGIPEGKRFKAVQTGGPSGGCIPASMAGLKVDYEELAKAGSIMGSGGMIVMDEDSCMVDVARYFLTFTHSESCGKCVPCRMGSQHLLTMLTEITEGKGDLNYIDKLERLSRIVKSGSLCGLGQTLPNPVQSALHYFREEFEAHLKKKQCEALVCKGLISSPCQYTCPINQDVPCYMGYIAQGKFKEAIDVIRKENPLPGICGRVCPHPCEAKCEAGKHGDPIAIRALKRFAADYEVRKGIMPQRPEVRYSERIAIIGSGPAGLSAGYYLALWGYQCTIFEALPVAGGMLAVGIPDYRLPGEILKHEIEYVRKLGVDILTNRSLGKDFTIDDLFHEGFRAVFLALGAHRPIKLGIEGADHPSVIPGVSFLRDINLGRDVKIGKRVAVIGGGNVAIDSARSALRLGSEDVFILYRRSLEEMPALPEEIEQLREEGINIRFLTSPKRIITDGDRVVAIECIKMELGEPDQSGRRRPVPVERSEFTIDCDTVIVAIGQTSDLGSIGNGYFRVSRQGTIEVHGETDLCNKDGVFAGGDVVTGPLNVVTAIFHGKLVARGIHQYLRRGKVEREYKEVRPAEYVEPVELTDEEIERLNRPEIPTKPVKERIKSFTEVEEALSEEDAVLEAKRCLRCDLEVIPT
ncbi:MAG: NADH-quinone oxidoreductase subunit NuoF [Deltaproteobacteria bacterium]|nr:NADH-quinone oxidoreductase subunit NuoF [Deltaproteobacteria bacterium]